MLKGSVGRWFHLESTQVGISKLSIVFGWKEWKPPRSSSTGELERQKKKRLFPLPFSAPTDHFLLFTGREGTPGRSWSALGAPQASKVTIKAAKQMCQLERLLKVCRGDQLGDKQSWCGQVLRSAFEESRRKERLASVWEGEAGEDLKMRVREGL